MGERSSQYERALRQLRAMILHGRLEASARLSEPALAEELGISRTPLRQAIARLVEEGLLERLDTGRCRVASFTTEDIFDAIELRGVIEGTAARLAAERGISSAHAREGRELLAGLDAAVRAPGGLDFEAYVALNARFHALLAELPRSGIIRREVERATRLPLASPSAFLQGQETVPDFAASLTLAQAQHRAIFEAITNREGARAEALMREHARLARQNLRHVLQAEPSLAAKVPGLSLISN